MTDIKNEIRDNKVLIDNPLRCDGNGPVYQLRKWYDQFYTDVADLKDGLKERKVFKIESVDVV